MLHIWPWNSRLETKNKVKTYVPGNRHSKSGFAAMSEDLDTGIGMLLDQIEKLGNYRKTLM